MWLMVWAGVTCGAIFVSAAATSRPAPGTPLQPGRHAVSAQSPRRQPQDVNSGGRLYREFCASCHGETGKGDGPMSDLARNQPPDLTALTGRHGGVFPRATVMASLDGSKPVAAHNPPAMRNWREVLLRLADGDEQAVQQRLEALVSYIESLQAKD